MRLLQLVPALLLTAPLALAVEHDAELRLTIGLVPGVSEVEAENSHTPAGAADPAANGTASFDATGGFTIEPSIMYHTNGDGFGLVGGPLAFFEVARGERASFGVERKLTSYGLGAEFGPSLQFDWLRLELLPYLAGGFAHAKAEVSTGPGAKEQIDSQDGWALHYGVRAGIYAASDQGIIGLQIGFEAFTAHVNFPAAARPGLLFDSHKETLSGAGLMLGFVAGVAF
jgi:hypothetical protein